MMPDKYIPVSAINEQIKAIDAEAARLNARIESLRIRQSVLEELRESAISSNGGAEKKSLPRKHLSFASAIVNYVKQHPGVHRDEVIEALASEFPSDAKDAKRSRRNNIYSLVKRGKLRQDQEERLYAGEEGQ